jgi:hypothetical protein
MLCLKNFAASLDAPSTDDSGDVVRASTVAKQAERYGWQLPQLAAFSISKGAVLGRPLALN